MCGVSESVPCVALSEATPRCWWLGVSCTPLCERFSSERGENERHRLCTASTRAQAQAHPHRTHATPMRQKEGDKKRAHTAQRSQRKRTTTKLTLAEVAEEAADAVGGLLLAGAHAQARLDVGTHPGQQLGRGRHFALQEPEQRRRNASGRPVGRRQRRGQARQPRPQQLRRCRVWSPHRSHTQTRRGDIQRVVTHTKPKMAPLSPDWGKPHWRHQNHTQRYVNTHSTHTVPLSSTQAHSDTATHTQEQDHHPVMTSSDGSVPAFFLAASGRPVADVSSYASSSSSSLSRRRSTPESARKPCTHECHAMSSRRFHVSVGEHQPPQPPPAEYTSHKCCAIARSSFL